MRANKLILAMLAVSTIGISGAALAMNAEPNTVPDNQNPVLDSASAALVNAKVPIATAIQEAQKSTGGDAVNALLFENSGDPIYLISLQDATGRGIIDVQVDAKTGQVYGEKGPMKMTNLEPQDSGA